MMLVTESLATGFVTATLAAWVSTERKAALNAAICMTQ